MSDRRRMMITILVPTFNEENNIESLLERIHSAFYRFTTKQSFKYEILFIDDSTDNTLNIIQEKAQSDMTIRVYHRSYEYRTGLATAFVYGFKKAKGEYICCLDSDLQHPPESIPQMIQAAINNDADIVVASRYMQEGSTEGLHGWYRKLTSWLLRISAYMLLPHTRQTSDPGSGFFIFHKRILDTAVLKPKGFKILIEILSRTQYNIVKDIPYTFEVRQHDESKGTLKQGRVILHHLIYLFFDVPHANRFLKFTLIGGSGVLVNLVTLFLLVEFTFLGFDLSWLLAVLISMISNFSLNNILTYKDIVIHSFWQWLQKLGKFILGSTLGMAINFIVYQILLQAGVFYLVAALGGIIAAVFWNFSIAQNVIWK